MLKCTGLSQYRSVLIAFRILTFVFYYSSLATILTVLFIGKRCCVSRVASKQIFSIKTFALLTTAPFLYSGSMTVFLSQGTKNFHIYRHISNEQKDFFWHKSGFLIFQKMKIFRSNIHWIELQRNSSDFHNLPNVALSFFRPNECFMLKIFFPGQQQLVK